MKFENGNKPFLFWFASFDSAVEYEQPRFVEVECYCFDSFGQSGSKPCGLIVAASCRSSFLFN